MLVCSTEKNDVKKGLESILNARKSVMTKQEWDAMVPAGIPPIIQVSMKDYKHLKTITAKEEMMEQAKKKEAKHVINLNTLTVHKKDCLYTGTNIIKAVLIRVKNTGLRICKHCQ